MTDPYARYTRLRFDRPHPKVLRITMDNGKMNTADKALHGELADIWREVDRARETTAHLNARAGKWREAREIVYNLINCPKPGVSAMRGVAVALTPDIG